MTWGDGCNLNNGNNGHTAYNLLAENNFVRGAGDDGVTVYSDGSSIEVDGAILRNNTTVASFWANGLRIAGGKHVRAENNLLLDNVKEAGLYIGVFSATGNNLDSAVITGNVIVRCGGRRDPAGMAINASPGGKLVNVTISNNTIKDAQFYGVLIGSNREIINFTNNIIDHPAETAFWVQGGSQGSAYIDSCQLINRIPGQLAYKNDAPGTFAVTFGKHNYGIPDTLPTAMVVPVARVERNTDITFSQSPKAISIHYVMPGENGMVEVQIYNSSGRLVQSGQKYSLHKGPNVIFYPIGNVGTGAYIIKVTTGEAGNRCLSAITRPFFWTDKK
jgi:hypothetical protein